MEKQTWNLTDIWNQQLIFGKKDRPFVKRDRIWASELGKSVYERWLIMNAIEPDFKNMSVVELADKIADLADANAKTNEDLADILFDLGR